VTEQTPMDYFDLDWSVDNIDCDKLAAPVPTKRDDLKVTEMITNKVHVLTFDSRRHSNLVEYALTHPNCVIAKKCQWRCTNYHPGFTVNMFRWEKWVLSTKEDNLDKVADMVEDAYGVCPVDIKVVNKTMIFRVNAAYSLDELYDYLAATADETEGVQLLDKQRYPAIICVIAKEETVTLEIYHKGAINATGMKGDNVEVQVQMVRDYINNRVLKFLETNY
jgi:hypothetical protein